jgi:hypothetical protein
VNTLDWRPGFADAPCFGGLLVAAAELGQGNDWPSLNDLDRLAAHLGIVNARGLPVRFEYQARKCSQRDYEDGIHATGRVPTRERNWHDLFNALIWLAWPRAKAALNATQQQALRALRAGRRGPLSDAATLFDESGLLLLAQDDTLARLLAGKQWRAAFWEGRELWRSARLYVFGHSLLEKSLAPTPGMTGKCLFLRAESLPEAMDSIPEWLDASLARAWQEGAIEGPGQLFPVPIMGVPGFDPANAEPDYYANEAVFRRPRVEPAAAHCAR